MSPVQVVSLMDLVTGTGGGPGQGGQAPGSCRTPGPSPPLAQPDSCGAVPGPAEAGFKAARLGLALRAGLPVLPGVVVPVPAARAALRAGADAVQDSGLAAGRVAVLNRAVDPALVSELRDVVGELGGRVIVRSSSPLEADPAWAGAFSSVMGVERDDVATAVRSCWAGAFAPDPLARLESCGLGLEALELAVLVQPEIAPEAGGVARIEPGCGVRVEGVVGHPGPLLSGWAEGARDAGLADLIGAETVADVAGLAAAVYAELGDDVIEWAACDGKVWLLQSQGGTPRSARGGLSSLPTGSAGIPSARDTPALQGALTSMASGPAAGMPGLAALIREGGTRVPARPAAPGTAAGPLLPCRPHQPAPPDCREGILLVDRPVPALAPLLFGARGVIARSGAAGSHLAEVARSLGVPMVTGCRTEAVTGPDPLPGAWVAAINGGTGEVALVPVSRDALSSARG